MAKHARQINGRLLLAGRRPWHEWRGSDLLDACDALRDDEHRFLIANGIKVPSMPDVDTHRIGLRTKAGMGVLVFDPPIPVDDGTWGEEDDAWSPPDDAEAG